MRSFALAVMFTAFAVPAAAQPFYIVHDKAADQCQVVTEKPATGATVELAGDGRSYATQVEAEAAVKTVKGCEGAAAGRTPAAK
jgi:hypothetical protein